MSSSEERLKILKMIQRGQITAESGFKLLEQLDRSPAAAVASREPAPVGEAKPAARWFHLIVTETASGKNRIDLRLPINVVTTGMKMGAKLSPEVDKLDPEALQNILLSGETGKIVDVYDETDGEHIEIFLE